jgi:hypothetical protein
MFFTTNPPSPDSADPELIQVLADLGAGRLNAADIPKFSDIDRSTAYATMPSVRRLPTDARRFVVRQMVEQSEANVELNFSRMLRFLLADPDVEVRALAIQGLWEDESGAFVDQLLSMLDVENESTVREAIAESLGRFALLASTGEIDGERAERIRRALLDLYYSDEPVATRKRALESVAYFCDDDEVEDAIAESFDSIIHEFRIGAIFSMGRNLADRWLPTVLDEMQDSDPEVRFEAARASGEFGDERAVSQLLDLLADEDPEVQMAAVGALGQIGGKVAVGALRRLVRSDDPVVSDAAQDALNQATIASDPLRLSP